MPFSHRVVFWRPLAACLFGFAALALAAPANAQSVAETIERTGPLAEYVARPDDTYGWRVRREGEFAGGQFVEMILTSQTWRDVAWKHQLFVLKPGKLKSPHSAVLLIDGGSWKPELEQPPTDGEQLSGSAMVLMQAANNIGSPVVILRQVPHQPIFDGKREDDAIAHTFEQFVRTGDAEWPLLLPMTKSAAAGMTATQEFAKERWDLDIQTFTVTGGSKRGWTTWLISASDDRVRALAPMVIDTLNMKAQMDHQLDTWGKYSEEIADYTGRGLPQLIASPAGEQLTKIVDPFSYREALVQPKLIILGSNDRYWTLDALNLYWDELVGPKYVLYCPNQGHGIKDLPRVVGTLAAFHKAANGDFELPQLEWTIDEGEQGATICLKSDIQPVEVSQWRAESPTKDFRDSVWSSETVPAQESSWTGEVAPHEENHRASFLEAVFQHENQRYYLSTNVRIVAPKKAP